MPSWLPDGSILLLNQRRALFVRQLAAVARLEHRPAGAVGQLHHFVLGLAHLPGLGRWSAIVSENESVTESALGLETS